MGDYATFIKIANFAVVVHVVILVKHRERLIDEFTNRLEKIWNLVLAKAAYISCDLLPCGSHNVLLVTVR